MRHDALSEKQVVERQLSVVNSFSVFTMTNAMARNFERFAHRIEMKTDDSWC